MVSPTAQGPTAVPCDWEGPFCDYGAGDYEFTFTHSWTSTCPNGAGSDSETVPYTCIENPGPGINESVFCAPPNHEANWFIPGEEPDCDQCNYAGDQDGDQPAFPAPAMVDDCDSDCGIVATTITAATYEVVEVTCGDGLDNDCDGLIDNGCPACVDPDDPGCDPCLCTAPDVWDSTGPGLCAGTDFAWESIPPQNDYCCGDDAGEFYHWYNQSAVDGCNDITNNNCLGISEDTTDDACCDNSDDCVFNSQCFPEGQGPYDLDGDGVPGAYCTWNAKTWRDCDASEAVCISEDRCGSLDWTAGGEDATFGEYNTGNESIECCGDDIDEYFITSQYISGIAPLSPNTSACCDDINDAVHLGQCREPGEIIEDPEDPDENRTVINRTIVDCTTDIFLCEPTECCSNFLCGPCVVHEVCDDGIDNDLNGYTDEEDPECCADCELIPGAIFDSNTPGSDACGTPLEAWESVTTMTQGCCGNNATENYAACNVPGVLAGQDEIDWAAGCVAADDACCDPDTDCVDPSTGDCYAFNSAHDVVGRDNNQDDGYAACSENAALEDGWIDCDYGASQCGDCAAVPGFPCNAGAGCWADSGEISQFGEYQVGETDCCGDDPDEYYVNDGGNTACCEDSSACVNAGGMCGIGYEYSAGGCTDAIDHDCDGLNNEDDDDCLAIINGTVLYQEDGTPAIGANATITATATDPVTGITVSFNVTTETANFSLAVIYNLSYDIVVILDEYGSGWEWDVNSSTSSGERRDTDISVVSADGCEPDCTFPGEDYCKPECHGWNGCLYYNAQAIQSCDGSKTGWIVPFTGGVMQDIQCCEGEPFDRSETKVVTVQGGKDIVRVTRIISYGGQIINLIIDVFK